MEIEDSSKPPADPFAYPVQDLCQTLQPPVNASVPDVSASPMAQPATYAGTAEDCSGFILQCVLYFDMWTQQFQSDQEKIAYIITLLTGCALQ